MNTVFKCLADPTRREILALLKQGPMTAGDLADRFPLAKPTLSGHFALLRNAGLIDAERRGTSITYHLNLSVLEEALLALADSVGLAGRLIGTSKEA